MDRLRGLLTRLRALIHSARADRDLDDELRFHLECEARANEARGLSAAEAKRAALLRFGSVDRFAEEARALRAGRWLDEARTDVRVAWRQLRRTPVFAIAAAASLALGIGANTAIFSVVSAVLLRELPFASPERLVAVWQSDRASDTSHEPSSWPDLVDVRAGARTLGDVAAFAGWDATVVLGAAEPERVSAVGVTPNFLSVLGIRPLHGRGFDSAAVARGDVQYVVVSDAWWRSRLNADAGALRTTLRINDRPAVIVGVVPADADIVVRQMHAQADYHVPIGGSRVDLYAAMLPDAQQFPRQTHPFLAVARLAPGVTEAAATRELTRIMAALEAGYEENEGRSARAAALGDVVFGPLRPALVLLLAAVALVLLVTCVNVANLLLAHTAARSREVAMRRALGAAGPRIARQLVVESALLTLLGTAAGLLVAHFGLRALVAVAPADIPRLEEAVLNRGVLLFALAVAAIVTLGFGLLPAVQLRRLDLLHSLRAAGGRTGTMSRAGRRFRAGLVVAEVAMAVSLVIGAGLLLRSFSALRAVDPGFRTAGVLKAQYDLPETRYRLDFSRWPQLPEIQRVHDEFLQRVQRIPGVESAALAVPHPLSAGFTNSFRIVGREAESHPEIRTRFVTPEYLGTMQVPLLRGRNLSAGDMAGATPVALINRSAAERYFGSAEPLGAQLRFWGIPWTIVGVIADEHFHGVASSSEPAVYAPLAQAPQLGAALLVRARGEPTALAGAVREELRAVDPQLALHGVEPLAATLAGTLSRPRFLAVLIALFGGVAALLALVGVHGVIGYDVAQRSTEVSVRLALGAAHGDVLRMIVGQGARLALLGTGIGVLLALVCSSLVEALLFGVSARDPITFGLVAGLVILTAVGASWLPARRVLRLPPAAVLHAE